VVSVRVEDITAEDAMAIVVAVVVVVGNGIRYTRVLINSGISPIRVRRSSRYCISRGNCNEKGRT
jgi:hypothetical protein